RDYLRWLDMESGLIASVWTNDSGSYRTESFCAYDGDVTLNRLTAPEGGLDAEVTVEIPGEKALSFGGFFFNPRYDDCTHEKK
ncbi:glycoside hydrolase N-terminal domain-containing protein, partial [Salmonella enterica]|uniref:glycoside hydrolase N-terminal domain-containing protein n=1 Tax=Salmonella enterica TaxID=28901 RepID=UPI003CEDF387